MWELPLFLAAVTGTIRAAAAARACAPGQYYLDSLCALCPPYHYCSGSAAPLFCECPGLCAAGGLDAEPASATVWTVRRLLQFGHAGDFGLAASGIATDADAVFISVHDMVMRFEPSAGSEAASAASDVFAGGLQQGYKDARGDSARFWGPAGLAAGRGFIFVADSWNGCIRSISIADSTVTTLAGRVDTECTEGGASVSCSSSLYAAAQSGAFPPAADGMGTTAVFAFPMGVAFDGSRDELYVTDLLAVRRVSLDGNVGTLLRGPSFSLAPQDPLLGFGMLTGGMALDSLDESLILLLSNQTLARVKLRAEPARTTLALLDVQGIGPAADRPSADRPDFHVSRFSLAPNGTTVFFAQPLKNRIAALSLAPSGTAAGAVRALPLSGHSFFSYVGHGFFYMPSVITGPSARGSLLVGDTSAALFSLTCGACEAGTYCAAGSDPLPCVAGHFCPPGVAYPVPCRSGTFSPQLSAISEDACVSPCPGGAYCPLGSSNALPCPAGTWSAPGAESRAACSPCTAAPGFACARGSRDPQGAACPPSHVCVGGAMPPVLCACTGCGANGLDPTLSCPTFDAGRWAETLLHAENASHSLSNSSGVLPVTPASPLRGLAVDSAGRVFVGWKGSIVQADLNGSTGGGSGPFSPFLGARNFLNVDDDLLPRLTALAVGAGGDDLFVAVGGAVLKLALVGDGGGDGPGDDAGPQVRSSGWLRRSAAIFAGTLMPQILEMPCFEDGDALTEAVFSELIAGLVCDHDGTLYLADAANHVIRRAQRVARAGVLISTIAGLTPASFKTQVLAAVAARPVEARGGPTSDEDTLALVRQQGFACAQPQPGHADGAGVLARLAWPMALALSGSTLYIADTGNHVVRALDTGDPTFFVRTVAGRAGVRGSSGGLLSWPTGVAALGKTIAVVEAGSTAVAFVDPEGSVSVTRAASSISGSNQWSVDTKLLLSVAARMEPNASSPYHATWGLFGDGDTTPIPTHEEVLQNFTEALLFGGGLNVASVAALPQGSLVVTLSAFKTEEGNYFVNTVGKLLGRARLVVAKCGPCAAGSVQAGDSKSRSKASGVLFIQGGGASVSSSSVFWVAVSVFALVAYSFRRLGRRIPPAV